MAIPKERILFGLLVIMCCNHSIRSEYSWSGSDWVWVEDSPNTNSKDANDEGSGSPRVNNNPIVTDDIDVEDGVDVSSGFGVEEEEVVESMDEMPNAKSNDKDIFIEAPEGEVKQPSPTTYDDPNSRTPYNPNINLEPSDAKNTSFFAQPGTLAAVVGGAVVGLLCAILCVMFVVYRMRKKDEGSYALDEPQRSATITTYAKNPNREFYA
ncbi:hypothetical protein TCAL_03162 [Tigriopus californicus]|uniref:Syndecan n=1 Tax=Tigriopus californicus TaxID=6832 RepID=A0A553P3J2_TIGCA|nr:syndecan-like [Tigriopus californicus]TRY72202.1 hypothetical protein TCAL_03162 [Tigriopus californicus]|eukprot:TCALIF_03162-PA protein Name:"Similar to Sdc Syndecan (Drosophila melanogaster)" AED:0.01 eAED:0.01 QI:364/1/1/1/1/1/4/60/209